MAEQQNTRFALQRIYVKDVSFESPKAPLVFREAWKPKVHVDMNTSHNALGDGNHEVVLSVTVTASDEAGAAVYVAEVQQAGVFLIDGLDGAGLAKTLGSFCPGLLFPYARELLDSVVVRGCFPPLMLAPINFEAIYEQVVAQQRAQAGAAAAGQQQPALAPANEEQAPAVEDKPAAAKKAPAKKKPAKADSES